MESSSKFKPELTKELQNSTENLNSQSCGQPKLRGMSQDRAIIHSGAPIEKNVLPHNSIGSNPGGRTDLSKRVGELNIVGHHKHIMDFDLNIGVKSEFSVPKDLETSHCPATLVPVSPGDNEAQIAALDDIEGNWEEVSETDDSDLESDEDIIEDNTALVAAEQESSRHLTNSEWFEDEALPLGNFFGFDKLDEGRIKSLLQDLNLDFGKDKVDNEGNDLVKNGEALGMENFHVES